MSETWQTILVLVLGWLLGLLSPAIVEGIRRGRDNIRGRAAIKAELEQLCQILVFAAFQARKAAGALDRTFLEWIHSSLKADTTSSASSLRVAIEACLAVSPEDSPKGVSPLSTKKATILQNYPVPLLDARVAALWTFETSFQQQLLEIHKDLALLADIVQQSREFFRLTFNEMTSTNHDLATSNLTLSYENYAERAKIIVDHIRQLQ